MLVKTSVSSKEKHTYSVICDDELIFNLPYPLKKIDNFHFPDLYYNSGWLIAYPIEIFHRPNDIKFKKAIKKLTKETKKLKVMPFVLEWAGNYSFGIKIKTKNPTREENEQIYKVFKHLKDLDWTGGIGVHKLGSH